MKRTRTAAVLLLGIALHACSGAAPAPVAPGPLLDVWGIEAISAKVSANGEKVDFCYRIRNAAKASAVVNRHVLPALRHGPSGTWLELPEQRRVGGARPPVKPEVGQDFFILFENGDHLVHAGDALTLRVEPATPVELVAQ